MTARYYLSPSGEKIPQAITEDHADVGHRILAVAGITPLDYADIYDQMEMLGNFRVVEFPNRVFAENGKCSATAAQMAFLQDRRINGPEEKELLINDELFTDTRRGGHLSHEALNERRSH